MTILAFAFVAKYGPNLPLWDDFDMVDVMVGSQRVTLDWLWSLHNEHRVPLPKLVLLLLYRLTRNDFRAGMYFNVAVLAALAAASIVIAGRRRRLPDLRRPASAGALEPVTRDQLAVELAGPARFVDGHRRPGHSADRIECRLASAAYLGGRRRLSRVALALRGEWRGAGARTRRLVVGCVARPLALGAGWPAQERWWRSSPRCRESC